MEQNELDACFNFINVPLVAIAIQKHEDRQLEKLEICGRLCNSVETKNGDYGRLPQRNHNILTNFDY